MDSDSLQKEHRRRFGACSPIAVIIGAWLCGSTLPAHAESKSAAKRIFRRDPPPHELVVRRIRFRHHARRAGRGLSVRLGQADQAPGRLQRAAQAAARLSGGDGPLGIHGHGQSGERPEIRSEQAPHRQTSCGSEAGRTSRRSISSSPHPSSRTSRSRSWPALRSLAPSGRESSRSRQIQPAGQVHDLRCLRVDLDAGQPEPAPQHHLQGLEEGAGAAVHGHRLGSAGGPVDLDGRPAPGGQRAAGHLAQRQSLRRRHVPAGGRRQGPSDRRRVGASSASTTSRCPKSSSTRARRKRTRRCRPTMSSPGTRSWSYLLGGDRACAKAARQLHPRGLPEWARDAGCTRATTRTSSASSAPATRIARHPRIRNRTTSEVTACSTPRRKRA